MARHRRANGPRTTGHGQREPDAHQLLRLLLCDPRLDPDDLDWSRVLPLAERHRLLLHLMDWFQQRGELAPEPFVRAAEAARRRNREQLELMAKVGARCSRLGVPHVFLKAAQHYPDLPRDVDLLIPAEEKGTDEIIIDHLPAKGRARLRSLLTGDTAAAIPQSGVVLHIRHGRLGRLGEHTRLPARVIERARPTTLGDIVCYAPASEDALLLQALSRFYGRPALRLRDVVAAVQLVRACDGLCWSRLADEARDNGLLPGLRRHLDAIEQIHMTLLGRPLLPLDARALIDEHAEPAEFRNDTFAYPAARVAAPLYLRQLATDIAKGDWGGAGRLFLLPLVAAAAGYRRLAHQRPGGS